MADKAKASTTESKTAKGFTAVVGISYPNGKGGEDYAAPGEPVPASVVEMSPWLLTDGAVTDADAAADATDGAEG